MSISRPIILLRITQETEEHKILPTKIRLTGVETINLACWSDLLTALEEGRELMVTYNSCIESNCRTIMRSKDTSLIITTVVSNHQTEISVSIVIPRTNSVKLLNTIITAVEDYERGR